MDRDEATRLANELGSVTVGTVQHSSNIDGKPPQPMLGFFGQTSAEMPQECIRIEMEGDGRPSRFVVLPAALDQSVWDEVRLIVREEIAAALAERDAEAERNRRHG